MGKRLMKRHASWPEDLARVVDARAQTPFQWGEHDCCLFAADGVAAMTGVDPARELRDTYHDARGAAKLLEARGGIAAIATAALGEPIATLLAQRGDVVLIEAGRGLSLGVCVGAAVAVPGDGGLVFFALEQAQLAWRV
jgi:hypothetical protein